MIIWGLNSEVLEVDCCSLECFFWCPMERPVIKYTRLKFLVAVGIESHAPSVFISEKTYSAQMEWYVTTPLKVLFARLLQGKK